MNIIDRISSFSSEEEYRSYPALNYSRLANFFREGYRGLYLEVEQTPALIFGSMVDSLTTTNDPYHQDFHRKFSVLPEGLDQLSPSALEAVKMIATLSEQPELYQIDESMVLRGLDETKYHTNWKNETRLKKFIEEAHEHYSVIKESEGKQLIPTPLYAEALEASVAVRQHPLVARFLYSGRYSVHYQVKLRSEWPELASGVKCMLDAVLVDQERRIIIPCDLKTTGKDEQDFPESIMKWNYWLQAIMYSDILRTKVNEVEAGWTILPFYFIVVSHPDPKPMVYRFDTEGAARDFFPSWVDIAKKAERYLSRPDRTTPFGMTRTSSNKVVDSLIRQNKYAFINKKII